MMTATMVAAAWDIPGNEAATTAAAKTTIFTNFMINPPLT